MATYKSIAYSPISGGGSMVLLQTETVSDSADITFDSGIDSTYKEYIFRIISMHPVSDSQNVQVNFRDGSTAYDATKTTTHFRCSNTEGAGDASSLTQQTGDSHLAEGTGAQEVTRDIGYDDDQHASGQLHLFNPSSTTFVKHFISVCNTAHASEYTQESFVAGYCNVTAAIDGVQFTFASGNIDSGTIKMYGVN